MCLLIKTASDDEKNLFYIIHFLGQIEILLMNTFKVVLQYLFNIFILFHTVLYIKLTLNLKYTQKCVVLRTWKKFGKPGKNSEKTSGNPVFI